MISFTLESEQVGTNDEAKELDVDQKVVDQIKEETKEDLKEDMEALKRDILQEEARLIFRGVQMILQYSKG